MPSIADDLLLSTIAERIGLWKVEKKLVRMMIDMLADVDAEILARLASKEHSAIATARFNKLRRSFAAVLDEGYATIGGALRLELGHLAVAAAEDLVAAVRSILPFVWDGAKQDRHTLEALVKGPFMGRLFENHFDNIKASKLAELSRVARNGILEGLNNDSIQRRIRGTRANGYADGVLEIGRRDVERLVRTMTSSVHARARQSAIAENDDIFVGYMAVVTLDERTCKICGPRDGLCWDLEFKPLGHSIPWDGGPGEWHWQCRCSHVPILGDSGLLERAGIDLSKLGTGKRAALDAPVSVDLNFDDWLRGQSLGRVTEVLGVRRAAWWLGHPDVSLLDAWKKDFRRIPID